MANSISKKIKQLSTSPESSFYEIISHSFWALIILGGAAFIQFAFDFLMARKFNAEGSGIFYVCFSIVSILSILSTLGLDKAMVRLLPPLMLNRDYSKSKAIQLLSIRIVASCGIALTVVLFVFSPWLAKDIFNKPELTQYLRLSSIAITPFSIRYVMSGSLKAIKRTKEALLVERVIVYSASTISIFVLSYSLGFQGLIGGFVAGSFLSVLFGFYFLKKYLPKVKTTPSKYSGRLLLLCGLPLLLVSVSNQLIGQVSTILLSITDSASDVGVYNVSLKVATVMALILTAINAIAATTISELYSAGKLKELGVIIMKTSSLAFIAAFPVYIFLILYPQFILSVFGQEFISGYHTLRIIGTGMFINVSMGPTVFILAMSGGEKSLIKITSIALAINIVTGLIAIPALGVLGAGLSTTVSLLAANIGMLLYIRRELGVWSLPFTYINIWIKRLL